MCSDGSIQTASPCKVELEGVQVSTFAPFFGIQQHNLTQPAAEHLLQLTNGQKVLNGASAVFFAWNSVQPTFEVCKAAKCRVRPTDGFVH